MHIATFVLKCVHNNALDLFNEYFVKTLHNCSTEWVPTETTKKSCYFLRALFFIIYHLARTKLILF